MQIRISWNFDTAEAAGADHFTVVVPPRASGLPDPSSLPTFEIRFERLV
jgi:hypothetical protein